MPFYWSIVSQWNTPGILHLDPRPEMEAERGKFQQPYPMHPCIEP
jgi:hypothetical protein